MSIGSIAPTYERRQFVDFLTPYQDLVTSFATYQGQPTPEIFVSVRILTVLTALSLVITWMVSSLVMYLFMLRDNPTRNKWFLYLEVSFNIIGTGFKQSKILIIYLHKLKWSYIHVLPEQANSLLRLAH